MTIPLFVPAEWARGRLGARTKVLTQFDRCIDWAALEDLARPLYDDQPGPLGGRPKHPLKVMIRLWFLARLYRVGDDVLEDAVADSRALAGFAGIDPWKPRVPSAETLRLFRSRIESGALTAIELDAVIQRGIGAAGLSLARLGTIIEPVLRRAVRVKERGAL